MLNMHIEEIELQLTAALKSLSKRVSRVEGVQATGLRLEAQVKQVQQRLEKTELESTDFIINSRKHHRQTEERLTALEHKETAQLTLFEELGKEIDGLKSGLKEGLGGRSLYENLRLRQEKLERVLGVQQHLLAERVLPVKENIKAIVLETIAELIDTRTLDIKTDLEIDKLRGQIKALESEIATRFSGLEAKPHRCSQLVSAVRKIDKRTLNIEDYLSTAASPPDRAAQVVLSNMEDRLAEIEREHDNYSSTNHRVADAIVRPTQRRVKVLEDQLRPDLSPKDYEDTVVQERTTRLDKLPKSPAKKTYTPGDSEALVLHAIAERSLRAKSFVKGVKAT